MSCLIIDTSGSEGYLAAAYQGKILQTKTLTQGRQLSKFLFPSILSLFESSPDFIAIGIGPGTFTGTRVGAIAGQSLAYGWGIPLVSFSSSLLPDLSQIALTTYQSFLSNNLSSQIELVYISKTT
ncbi:MAG: tRNA (adenosine(37)-N6)-threonylcarbamoyltransferase complex dimerization subunit type 1 TsaB [Pyrinomonadaceae bacterium]